MKIEDFEQASKLLHESRALESRLSSLNVLAGVNDDFSAVPPLLAMHIKTLLRAHYETRLKEIAERLEAL